MYLAQRMFRNTQTQSVNGSWVGKQDFNEEKEYIPLENLYPWLLMEPHNKKKKLENSQDSVSKGGGTDTTCVSCPSTFSVLWFEFLVAWDPCIKELVPR